MTVSCREIAYAEEAASIIRNTAEQPDEPVPAEAPVTRLPLSGPAWSYRAELSGMAWYGDTLILLPQFPNRFGTWGVGMVFGLAKQDILDYLDGKRSAPLLPVAIPIETPGLQPGMALESLMPGFEGFESIAFDGNTVYLTIEVKPDRMMGYVISGEVQPGPLAIHLDPTTLKNVEPQANLDNLTEEALILYKGSLYTIYEANGAAVNPSPVAHRFDLSLVPQSSVPFPRIEYRITDATPADEEGRFWAINTFFPPDAFKLEPQPDELARKYGEGLSHRDNWDVERLVMLQITAQGIQLVDRPPIQLNLWGSAVPRNWEGIARLDERGFLLATDKFPGTILAFVPAK